MNSSVESVTSQQFRTRTRGAQRLRTLFWTIWVLLLIVKVVFAATLAPFGDEAWYWQESRALDWSYSDLPLATALLIRLGETLLGHGVLAMRIPFLLLGALLPFLLVRTGTRLFGERAGWSAGLLALALPLVGSLGIFALPDVPLTFSAAWALDALERAAARHRLHDWVELGLALAAAWLSHYRAGMLILTGLGFLCLLPRGRALWRDRGLWLALAVMGLGLQPLLIFNFEHHWAALGFQLIERNPWSFHADALMQPIEQAIVCTPVFYVAMLWTAWHCVQRARAGGPWDLLAACALVPLIGYFVLGCFADDTRFRIHWPLVAYLPLLIALPALIAESAETAGPTRKLGLRAAAGSGLGLLVVGSMIGYTYLALAAIPNGAMVLSRFKAFPEHWVGWREAAQQTRSLLDRVEFKDAILVADNFMLAAELDFALDGQRPVYSLDHPLNGKHGRAPELAIWKRDEAGLRELGQKQVLLVVEPTARRERERAVWLDGLCSRIDDLARVDRIELYGGRKRYLFFSGTIPAWRSTMATSKCDELVK